MRYDPLFRSEMRLAKEYGIPHSVLLEEWSDEDRAKALAFEIEESLYCQLCGTAAWEWEEDPYAYEPVANICPGCEKKEYARDSSDDHAGLYVTLRKK